MCLMKKPLLRDYWPMEPLLHTNNIRIRMSRYVLTMLCLSNNGTHTPTVQTSYDPLYKVKHILSSLTIRFCNVYTPEENLITDAVICVFRERIFFHVYKEGKPHKCGIKI
jgi:hypothetical protein